MRKLFLFGLITISSTLIFGQISQGGSPSSFSLLGIKDVPTYNIEKPNMEQVSLEDDIDAKQGNIYRYGRSIFTNINVLQDGIQESLPNGNIVFRLILSSDDALALGVNFSEFWLPTGSKLFIYTPNKQQILGAYTSENNNSENIFATELLKGSEAVIEYEVSSGNEKEAKLIITELNYAYRGVD